VKWRKYLERNANLHSDPIAGEIQMNHLEERICRRSGTLVIG
jgi:hypothetical protein